MTSQAREIVQHRVSSLRKEVQCRTSRQHFYMTMPERDRAATSTTNPYARIHLARLDAATLLLLQRHPFSAAPSCKLHPRVSLQLALMAMDIWTLPGVCSIVVRAWSMRTTAQIAFKHRELQSPGPTLLASITR